MKKFILAFSLILCYTGASADQKLVFVDVPDSDYKVKCIKETVNNALSCNWDEWNENERARARTVYLIKMLEVQAKSIEMRMKANESLFDDLLNQFDDKE